ncbi:MAG TPA: endonuclease/exonuclease/phosphatase family protein [Kofleriaceae bacterium]|nr:endonuclease/exonuclease/phosphatase family protein [Kofleriaceae bacterium]
MIVPFLVCGRQSGPALRVATFNIEDFPKNRRQIDGAFAEMAALGAGIIAVQEIGEPGLFAHEAHRLLGERWGFAHVDTRPIGETRRGHHIGVLFDGARWQRIGMRVHDATRLEGGRHKPTLEVRLRSGDLVVHVLVVHLKSGSDGRDIRARQFAALAGIVREVQRAGEPIVLAGDFNATELGDRDDLDRLARDTGLVWASEPLACSAFWARDDGCPRSRLDHMLTWKKPQSIRAAGACATEGCDWQASCPVYTQHVSDHCPVVVTFE